MPVDTLHKAENDDDDDDDNNNNNNNNKHQVRISYLTCHCLCRLCIV
jgi:hypothetical protein